MRACIGCLSVVAVAMIANAAMATPVWYSYDGHYYAISDTSGDWTQTESEAARYGGHLVAINSAAENAWLVSAFPQTAFIGLRQPDGSAEPAGNWGWSNGEALTYTNWRPGQPDDYLGRNDYGQINIGAADGLWDDVDVMGYPEDRTYQGIMEVSDLTWYYYKGHKYALTNGTGTWDDLEAQAKIYGGHLVTINSAAENDWLVNTFNQNSLFIGLYQPAGSAEPAGGWSWISGEAVTYLNWQSGQPDGYMAVDNYAMMNVENMSGQWHDVGPTGWPLGGSYRGIVEVIVPEPASMLLILAGAAIGIRRRSL